MGVSIVSEYGKRTAPVVVHALSPEALERWRARARTVLNNSAANDDHAKVAAEPEQAAVSEAAGDAAQRRATKRQRTLIGAKVVFNDMMSTYDCVIRDLSESGARVKLNAPVQVPNSFMLRFSDGRIRQCKVKRRIALELGVEFVD
jgi:hypothetical protein